MSDLRKKRQLAIMNNASQDYVNGMAIQELCKKYSKSQGCIYRWIRIIGGDEKYDQSAVYQKEKRLESVVKKDNIEKSKQTIVKELGYIPAKLVDKTLTDNEKKLLVKAVKNSKSIW